MTSRPVSERQLSFIRTLVVERVGTISSMPEAERATLLVQPTDGIQASRLIDRLLRIKPDPKQADPEQVAKIDGLRAVIDRLDARDRAFAVDLIDSFDKKGDLSPRQWPWVTTLTAKATTPVVEVEPGLYRVDGSVVKVYLTDKGRLACKRLVVLGTGRGSFRYERGLLGRVLPEHALTEAEAQAFGRQHGLCCACARHLDDERSLAVGYGPVCADHYGWHYPNYDEASKILNRPVSL